MRAGLVNSAHDCSDGGFSVAVAESAITGGTGAKVDAPLPERWDAALFGEGQSRIVISLAREQVAQLELMASELEVPMARLGTVGGSSITFGEASLDLSAAADSWEHGFERATGG